MKDKIKNIGKSILFNEITLCIVVSWFLTFLIEIFARHSMPMAFSFMIYHSKFFLSNFTIILCAVSVCVFFKRRYFVLSIISILWIALGVTNGVILTYRNTPLAAVDFSIVKSALDIMNSYVKPIQIINFISLLIFAIVVSVVVWKYAPKVVPKYKRSVIYFCITVVLCIGAMVSSYNIYNNPECFANLPEAYKNYGFAYCFSCSAVNRGVDKPHNYSEDTIKQIINKIDDESEPAAPSVEPNIIYVQLESFFDVKHMKNVKFSEDPVPNFTKLKEQYSSGFLRIPGLGGGTCNAEFEVLTGMSVGLFGTCEYPYKTITLDHTSGSVCYDLKKYGYSTHAVHDHTGTFYDRHINYSNLGFDTFTPVEYIHDVERNPNNWAKDKILTGEIFKCLNSTEGRDIVFTVSVQGHGKYPTEVIDDTQTIFVESGMDDEEYKIGFEYYINQIHEMDEFVLQLTEAAKRFNEPTVIVFYGDHLPAISIAKKELDNNNLFQTEYIIWSNFGMPVEDKDLYAYQLTPTLTSRLGFDCNYISKLHTKLSDNPEYMTYLQTLMYDELYGKNYAYNCINPNQQTAIKYGIDPIYITSATPGTTSTCIKGSGFTEKSKAYVNGKQVSATYLDTNTLLLSKKAVKEGDEIYIAQVCSDKFVLGRTESHFVTYEEATMQ